MTDSDKNKQIQECDKQLNSLYTHFGNFIYDNMEKENIFYCFEPEYSDLEEEATGLLRKIKYPDSKQKEERPKFDGKTRLKEQSEPQEQPKTEEKPKKKTNIKRRFLKPYADLNVELYAANQKLDEILDDIDQVLDLAQSSLDDSIKKVTSDLHVNLKETKSNLVKKINMNMEVIKNIMGNKKLLLEKDDTDSAELSKLEKTFLDKSGKEIKDISKEVDSLVSQGKDLLRSIKKSYENSLKIQQELQEQKIIEDNNLSEQLAEEQKINEKLTEQLREKEEELQDLRAKETIPAPQDEAEQEIETEEINDIAPAQEPTMEEEPQEQDENEEPAAEEEPPTDQEDREEEEEEKFDYGIIETASRKLKDKETSLEEKQDILNTVFYSIPDTAGDFICNLLVDVELDFMKEIMSLLHKVEDSLVLDIYKRFLDSDDSFLRISGIMGLSRWNSNEAKDALLEAAEDPDYAIRRLVANCINNVGNDIEMSCLVKLTNDPDEGVSRIAIRKLGALKNRFAFINILPKLDSPDIKIRREAITAIQNMTGTNLGYRYMGPEKERKLAIKKWQNLWNNNQTNPHFFKQIESGVIKTENKKVLKPKKPAPRKAVPSQKHKKKVTVKRK